MQKKPTVFEKSAGGIVYKRVASSISWLIVKHKGALHWGFPKGHIGDKNSNEVIEEAVVEVTKPVTKALTKAPVTKAAVVTKAPAKPRGKAANTSV